MGVYKYADFAKNIVFTVRKKFDDIPFSAQIKSSSYLVMSTHVLVGPNPKVGGL